MPQIDNVTFFPQVVSSFLILVFFSSFTLKTHSLILASSLKVRANLFYLVASDLSFKAILHYIYVNYSYQYIYILNKVNTQVPSI